MKKLLVQYGCYNLWANQLIISNINNLTDEQIYQQSVSSFPTIFKTLEHMWDAESIWWQRMKLIDNVIWPSSEFKGTIMELGNNLIQQSKQWKEWIELATEAALEHEYIYQNSKKDRFKQPVYETIQHLFNHQSFHRGQLISQMKFAGCTKIPNTDLIAFLRKK